MVRKGERQWGWGRKTPASIQGPRVNLGRATAVNHGLGIEVGTGHAPCRHLGASWP
jgi:hypothetical protein